MAQTTAPATHAATTAAPGHEAVAPSGLAALGVNGPLLAAQIVNFLIVLAVLRAVAFRPILAMLARRRAMIEDSVAQAERTKIEAASSQQAAAALLGSARQEARELVEQARANAERVATDITTAAETQSNRLIEQTRAQLEQERAAMKAELEQELGGLVVLATERVLQSKHVAVSGSDVQQALRQELGQHGA